MIHGEVVSSFSKKNGVLFLILLLSFSILTPAIAQYQNLVEIQSFGSIKFLSPLHIEGRYIKDELGNTIILKGFQKHGFEDDPEGRWKDLTGYYFNQFIESVVRDNLQAIKNWGANSIRVIDRVSYWQDNTTGQNGKPHRDCIKQLIQMAAEEGIYVIYCLFSNSE